MANEQLLLRNLHTFNVAAKSLSFTVAAKQLHLTQGAVSHRIKTLETELGFALFVRGTRKLELTPEGRRFQATLSQSLHAIFGEIEEIKTTDMQGELTVATSPGFANGWLIPRLRDFRQKFPGFNVILLVSDEPKELATHNIDVAIYYGQGEHKDCYAKRLFGEQYIPVCTPEYASELNLYESGLTALKSATFIHSIGSDAWERWAVYMKLDVELSQSHYSISQLGFEIPAARNSLGIAMGRYQFVKAMIDSGELVAPFPSMPTSKGYDLLCLSGSENRPKIKTFMDWVERQLS